MSITVNLPPALEDQLREAAAQENQEVSELAGRFLALFLSARKAKIQHREVPAVPEKQPRADFRYRRLARVGDSRLARPAGWEPRWRVSGEGERYNAERRSGWGADWVTIERAAEHLNISVAGALALAEYYPDIRRARLHGTMVYSLTGFANMHLKDATAQRVRYMRGRAEGGGVLDEDSDATDAHFSRWLEDGGPETL